MSTYWKKHTFLFKQPSGTSRGVMLEKHSWFIIQENEQFQYSAIGECSIIEGLSPDPIDQFEAKLDQVCAWLNDSSKTKPELSKFPAIQFGLEMFLLDQLKHGSKVLFESAFVRGTASMLINGLVWMGSTDYMKSQVNQLVNAGFRCIKLKIGSLKFEEELKLLNWIRTEYGSGLELRVDANGAFDPTEVQSQLNALATFNLHSIEQPIKSRQWEKMAQLCSSGIIPIGLDEELIGIQSSDQMREVLETIKPQYIILKPSLVGGFGACHHWIKQAESLDIEWWITSALESNIGLNAIAQYAFEKGVKMPQGLGTGSLYDNNVASPLYIQGEMINFDPLAKWNLTSLLND